MTADRRRAVSERLRRTRKRARIAAQFGPDEHLDYWLKRLPAETPVARRHIMARAFMSQSRSTRVEWLARSAAVSRAPAGREKLVRLATRDRYGYAAVRTAVDNAGPSAEALASDRVLRALGSRATMALAWLLFVQNLESDDYSVALALYDAVHAKGTRVPPAKRHQNSHVELMVHLGKLGQARAHLARRSPASLVNRWLDVEVINPYKPGNENLDVEEWLHALNQPFAQAGWEHVHLGPDATAPPFQRLTSEATATVDSPTCVTVVISSFEPDHMMLHAVRSVAAQSWRNLEILVVDDASGAGYDHWYREAEGIDPRVTVHRMPFNGGTYRIRNYALDHAQGELVTFHDSDDWMHPRRIETQARALLDNPGAVANASKSARVTANMELVHGRNVGTQICEPSLMIRRTHAVAKVGYFDAVRKGADAEYRMRMEAALGVATPVVGDAPLTFQLISPGSLSNSDIMRHWFTPERRVYRSCFELWHRTCLASGEIPYMPRDVTLDARPFYAPPPILGVAPGDAAEVVVVSNWLEIGTWERTDSDLEALIIALLSDGIRVAIAHVSALEPIQTMRWALSPSISAVLNNTELTFESLDHLRDASVMVTRDLQIAELLDDVAPGGHVVVADGTESPSQAESLLARVKSAV